MTDARLLTQLADHVRELTHPYQETAETWTWSDSRHKIRTTHHIWHPALLDQLTQAAALNGRLHIGTIGRHTLDGTVPAAIETLDTIRRGTTAWLRLLGANPSPDLKADLRALVGVAPALDHVTLKQLAGDIWHYRRSCQLFGGW